MAKKRGRPRKNGKRYPCGDLMPATDHGTPEVQSKRKAMVGDADPALAASAAGILLARGLLDDPAIADADERGRVAQERYHAADRYRRLRCALYGVAGGARPSHCGEPPTEDKLISMQAAFDAMVIALTPVQRLIVDAVCFLDRPPTSWECVVLTVGLDRIRAARPTSRATEERRGRAIREGGQEVTDLLRKYAMSETCIGVMSEMG